MQLALAQWKENYEDLSESSDGAQTNQDQQRGDSHATGLAVEHLPMLAIR
jgi:hypothetical protein